MLCSWGSGFRLAARIVSADFSSLCPLSRTRALFQDKSKHTQGDVKPSSFPMLELRKKGWTGSFRLHQHRDGLPGCRGDRHRLELGQKAMNINAEGRKAQKLLKRTALDGQLQIEINNL